MSRVANSPVSLPKGIEVNLSGQHLVVKGGKGSLEHQVHDLVEVTVEEQKLQLKSRINSQKAVALAGTTRALINNMVTGVSKGFERKLTLVGVGYRAQAQGNNLNLTLGYSHPVDYQVPDGITIQTPSQTEIIVTGCDKQRVGQVAADIRAYRSPEPYKGKGIRYSDEHVAKKEAKKK